MLLIEIKMYNTTVTLTIFQKKVAHQDHVVFGQTEQLKYQEDERKRVKLKKKFKMKCLDANKASLTKQKMSGR